MDGTFVALFWFTLLLVFPLPWLCTYQRPPPHHGTPPRNGGTRSQRRWAPILRNLGLNGPGAAGVSPEILPETAAFKIKIKVLAAWFPQGARTAVAPVAVAGSDQRVHGGGDRSVQKVAAAKGQPRHAVSTGSRAHGGAKATGVGRRTGGGGPAARKVSGGSGGGADAGRSASTTAK